ncbi:hypothetical protein [Microcoleus sp. D3_18a_C4]|uniref:hypothetical protein n=1 Tax=Microcoleus sp. D3_18a_C4 TaxID=3055332 RepID=UPI002FD74445
MRTFLRAKLDRPVRSLLNTFLVQYIVMVLNPARLFSQPPASLAASVSNKRELF